LSLDDAEKFGLNIVKRALEEPIRQLCVYTVKITLHKDIAAKLKVWVVKEEK